MEPAQTEGVARRLKELAWVDDIQYSGEWIEKFAGLIKFIELAALVIGVFLAAATVFIVSNTIRLAVYSRRDEIEIARLVGASASYIRIPFFIEGVLEGVFGGVLAFFMLWAGRFMVAGEIPRYVSFVVEPAFPAASIFAALLLAGVAMGAAGSIISMGRFLKV
jgi:cell division transport system permease protein